MTKEQLFENTHVISLPHRFDRRFSVEKELQKLKIPYSFFDAVNGHELDYSGPLKKGEYGVKMSHAQLLTHCVQEGNKSCFIFEDDVEFPDDILSSLDLALESLPEDVDLFYLGASHHQRPIHYKNNIYKITHSYCAHAVWISSKVFNKILDIINAYPGLPVDVCYAILQPTVNAYAAYPHLAWQKNTYSDIQNEFVNYDFVKEEFVRFDKYPLK
jgi:GR25 family glycosyltransferase involved in LPS biosynthesis